MTKGDDMDHFYVNKNAQANGDHEVHKHNCAYKPLPENSIYLGQFLTCHDAVREAEKHYRQSDGCFFCCPECHSS